MMNARDYLIALYLDWVNNHITVGVFAEHHGLTVEEANTLITLMSKVRSHPHPDE